jgi:DcuC family C4-dicarboxylate transporter
MTIVPLLALALIALAVFAVARGWDVRLVLAAAAVTLAALGGDVQPVAREFLGTFSNEKFVVPICSAMGFAYVLRHTGCERHLVLLLVRPLRYARRLLVPGVILVGFLVNVPVISQTSTAVCIAPVIIPLMRAAGYPMATVGAALLLGASVGGELLNPGAPELLTVFDKTGVPTVDQAGRYLPPLVFTQLAVSLAVFWAWTAWRDRNASVEAAADDAPLPERINLLKAAVPLVPLALLFAAGMPEPYKLFDIPDGWVILPKNGQRDPAYSSRLIGLSMLVGVAVATAVSPGKARDCVKQFFDGAGYGFANVVSLIVIANCFGVAIREVGLAAELGRLIEAQPGLMRPLAAFVPMAFAAVSGSGMASTQSLYGFFHGPAVDQGADPTAVGSLVAVGSAAGRTMSPVAAVALMCASLTGTKPLELVKRVAPPLLAGLAVVVALVMAGVLK